MDIAGIEGKDVWPLLKHSFNDWSQDKAPKLAAALATYTMLAIAPLLVIVTKIVGVAYKEEAAQGKVAILGLSYKPNTAVVDESQGVLIAHLLTGRGLEVTAYDPMAMDSAQRVLRDGVKCAESAQACITNADVILIATPWEEFRDLDYTPVKGAKRPLIIDSWGLLDGLDRVTADVLKLGVYDGPRARS